MGFSLKESSSGITIQIFNSFRLLWIILFVIIFFVLVVISLQQSNSILYVIALLVLFGFFVSLFGQLLFGKIKIETNQFKDSFTITVPKFFFPFNNKYSVNSKLNEIRLEKTLKQKYYLNEHSATLIFSNGQEIKLYPKLAKYTFLNVRGTFDLPKQDAEKIAKFFNAKITKI